ncbi:MAG: glucokinase [Pseudomonadota bacterium]
MAEAVTLVGDIGGTNARFALVAGDNAYRQERVFSCESFSDADAAIAAYLDETQTSHLDAIYIAAAGRVMNGACRFMNNHWFIDEAALRARFGCARAGVFNDFVAVAYGLPGLHIDYCTEVGHSMAPVVLEEDFNIGVIGPGTGLGAGALLGRGGQRIPIESEAGHMAFAPESTLQRELLDSLAHRFERVSCERLLSGLGLENIYLGLAEVHGLSVKAQSAAQIFAQSQDRACCIEREATDLFFSVLGQVTGDLALAYGVKQGMYVAGGIVQRYPSMLRESQFRACFTNKGRHSELLERVPTYLVEHPYPGLFGAAEYARLKQPR